ncbi:hypothetical protein ACETU7_16935 [Rhodococcus sp. 3Y1]
MGGNTSVDPATRAKHGPGLRRHVRPRLLVGIRALGTHESELGCRRSTERRSTSIVAAQEQQEWVDYCVGVADSRIKLSAVIGVVGVLVGAATVVLSTIRPRWLLRM